MLLLTQHKLRSTHTEHNIPAQSKSKTQCMSETQRVVADLVTPILLIKLILYEQPQKQVVIM